MKLYSYFRSSAAYRVRIGLNLKGLAYEMASIHLTKDGGRQFGTEYRGINPQMRVPSLVLDDGQVLTQSMAILDYLDEVYPEPSLLPQDPVSRARVRAISQIIACDIHPINNLAPLKYIKNQLGHDQDAVNAWYTHWVVTGFEAIEALINPGPFTLAAQVTMADICLVPQVYNAQRFNISLDRFPKIAAVNAACLKLPAFDKARPENQPDAE
ncbi:MAG TPA: maleylacetoacetate isomerase [Xanthobacteraceae bacterium]|nr:maleylacetoacetate isomerase [Xanthobacteraceae bacterium]